MAAQSTGPINALSQADIENLLSGRGMGFAQAAELNHYPGPRHVLDLAEPLALSDSQRQASQAIFDQMHAQALILGRQLVDAEHALDAHFARADLSEADLDQHLSEIARISANLRGAHLKAHLAERRRLTPEQISRYDMLRNHERSDHSMHSGR